MSAGVEELGDRELLNRRDELGRAGLTSDSSKTMENDVPWTS